ncbi:unnamed protein product [Symbiodinium natans]|uniref:Uncharacterized protein n=1 Tax=Symbiodinium natans TaxID=878477 RepID=A0A812KEH3_9DINO|nr:unnamed protein product [Symbiodinium natans]
MAPKKNQNKPKATAAKAKVKASAAKSKMHKPRLQPMRVKQEGSKTPPRTKNKPEMDVDDSAGPAASGTLGFARGTISALLTSLKCQAKSAKKISQEDKESAQKTLEDRRDSADTEKKRMILGKLQEYGVKNCSWIHSLHQSVETKELNTESVLTDMLTRSRIFQLVEKEEILEEILSDAEKKFEYSRLVEKHPKYATLNKCLFKHSQGLVDTQTTGNNKKVQLGEDRR